MEEFHIFSNVYSTPFRSLHHFSEFMMGTAKRSLFQRSDSITLEQSQKLTRCVILAAEILLAITMPLFNKCVSIWYPKYMFDGNMPKRYYVVNMNNDSKTSRTSPK